MLKRLITSLLTFLFLTGTVLGLRATVLAEAPNPLDTLQETIQGETDKKKNLPDFTESHPASSSYLGADIITSIIYRTIDFLKYTLGGIAILMITISGVRLITAGKKVDEISEKEKWNIRYVIYGLLVVMLADQFVKQVVFGEYGECLASKSNAQECARMGSLLIRGIYNFVEAFIGIVAVFIIIVSAFRLVTSAGNEETIGKEKKRILFAVLGLLIIGISELAIKDVIFRTGGTKSPDIDRAIELINSITNFASAFIGTISFLVLLYGGAQYVFSIGNEEKVGKAKKIIVGAIVGIGVALGAFATVRTITSLRKEQDINLPRSLSYEWLRVFSEDSFLGSGASQHAASVPRRPPQPNHEGAAYGRSLFIKRKTRISSCFAELGEEEGRGGESRAKRVASLVGRNVVSPQKEVAREPRSQGRPSYWGPRSNCLKKTPQSLIGLPGKIWYNIMNFQ